MEDWRNPKVDVIFTDTKACDCFHTYYNALWVMQWILLPAGEYYHCLLLDTARFDVLDLYSSQRIRQMNRADENRKSIYQKGRRLCNSNCYRCIYGWRRRDRWWRHHGNGGSDRLYSPVGYERVPNCLGAELSFSTGAELSWCRTVLFPLHPAMNNRKMH
jgi:hypothetical protein